MDKGTDTVTDFHQAEGDKLVLTDVLDGGKTTIDPADYISVGVGGTSANPSTSSTDAIVQVFAAGNSGTAGAEVSQTIILQGALVGTTLTQLEDYLHSTGVDIK